jgi:CHAT domain-containing protein
MHRPDKPDFSFIELADGQLFADDLIQLDLHYALITLSGCETGRLAVKQSEEMIGLIRGALLAGADSLIVSFWHIDDQMTADIMDRLYTSLKQGKSRSYAIAAAQRSLKAREENVVPAQWGAFQLIGESGPLHLI